MSDFVNILFIKIGQALWDSSEQEAAKLCGAWRVLPRRSEQKKNATLLILHPEQSWAVLSLALGHQECCSPMDDHTPSQRCHGDLLHGGRICISDSQGLVCKRKISLSSHKPTWVYFSMRLNFYYKKLSVYWVNMWWRNWSAHFKLPQGIWSKAGRGFACLQWQPSSEIPAYIWTHFIPTHNSIWFLRLS